MKFAVLRARDGHADDLSLQDKANSARKICP
jgi:hypothetical protein